MDRINSDNIGYDAQGRRIFKDGPPATTLPAQWCTGIQEEMMAVIESEGFAGSVSDNTLILKAITAAIARATDNYVTVHDLGTKNILSQYSSFDLDLYISGGVLAKPSGWKCRIAASNGNGSYYCDLSTTYNINGISALNWRMSGGGYLTLELGNITNTWTIIDDDAHIFDTCPIPDAGLMFDRTEYRKVDNRIKIVGRYYNPTVAINIASNNSFRSNPEICTIGRTLTENLLDENIIVVNVCNTTNEVQGCLLVQGASNTTSFQINFWRDATGTNLDCDANFVCTGKWR